MTTFNRQKMDLQDDRGEKTSRFRQRLWLSLGMGAVMALSTACKDDPGDVKAELEDLQKAREKAPQVAQELRGDLQVAKKEVATLSEKVAMAERGITDDVLKEREDVVQALDKKGEAVEGDVGEARESAEAYNQTVVEAEQALEETQSADVETEVQTDTRVQPTETNVERTREETSIPVEKVRVPDVDVEESEEQEQTQEQAQPQEQEEVMEEESAEPAPAEPTTGAG